MRTAHGIQLELLHAGSESSGLTELVYPCRNYSIAYGMLVLWFVRDLPGGCQQWKTKCNIESVVISEVQSYVFYFVSVSHMTAIGLHLMCEVDCSPTLCYNTF